MRIVAWLPRDLEDEKLDVESAVLQGISPGGRDAESLAQTLVSRQNRDRAQAETLAVPSSF